MRRDALNALARIYRPACMALLLDRGFRSERADEVTQGFFTDVVLARKLLEGAAPHKGRLRSLIRRALENYALDAIRRSTARAHHEEQAARAADDAAKTGGTVGDAGSRFDAEWARAQLSEALARTRSRSATEAQRQGWALFERLVLFPAVYGTERPEMRDAVRETGTPDAARGHVLLRETRMRVLQALEEVVSETIDHPGDFAGEIAYIRKLLADGVMARG